MFLLVKSFAGIPKSNISMKSGIYIITSPTSKIYIGQAVDIDKRFIDYRRLKCKKQTHLYNSFLRHGVEKHLFEILQRCPVNDLNETERFYIKKFDSFNSKNGMNLTDGGGANGHIADITKHKISLGNKGKTVSSETRLIMSIAQRNIGHKTSERISKRNIGNSYKKGHSISKELIQKMKDARVGLPGAMKGKRHSVEAKAKMRLIKLGKKVSEATALKISMANKGRPKSEETKLKMSVSRKKYLRSKANLME